MSSKQLLKEPSMIAISTLSELVVLSSLKSYTAITNKFPLKIIAHSFNNTIKVLDKNLLILKNVNDIEINLNLIIHTTLIFSFTHALVPPLGIKALFPPFFA